MPQWYGAAIAHSLNGIALHEMVTDDGGAPLDYVFLEVNDAFQRIIGHAREDLVGRRVTEVFPGIEQEPWIATYGRVVDTGEPVFFEQHSAVLDKDFEVHAFRAAPGQFVTIFHDVTPYVHARHALEHSEALRRSVIESSADHIMLLDLDGTIRYINRTVQGLEHADVIGTDIRAHVEPRWHETISRCLQRVIETGRPDRFEVEYEYEDGNVGYFESRVGAVKRDEVVVALTVSASDRTEFRGLEEKLRQSQKMEAIGRLAGGVAHDFNNLLTGIKGYGHLALTRPGLDARLADDLAQIATLADQAADLTGQLLAFSRRQPIDLQVVNVNSIIEDVGVMLRRLLGEEFVLEVSPAADLLNVRADRGQIQQILMNLVVNARDAMGDGGRILIDTENLAEDAGAQDHPLGGCCGVCIRVTDDGPGIAAEALPHIFEPFFTTKGVGRGTGLGLATVYGIVRQHDGNLRVRSEPRHGACFEVFLPAVDKPVEEVPARPARRKAPHGSETVMVVEDEDAVREVTSRILQARGYNVVEAPGPEAAREIFERQHVDLLLTDVVMPGGDGPSLFLSLAAAHADLKVVYMSGYAEPAGISDVAALGAPFLRKPFAPDLLVQVVRDCLDG